MSNLRSIDGGKSYDAETQHSSGGGGGDSMEARIARVESDCSNIKTQISDINGELKTIRENMRQDFRTLAGIVIVASLGLAWLIATGFNWI